MSQRAMPSSQSTNNKQNWRKLMGGGWSGSDGDWSEQHKWIWQRGWCGEPEMAELWAHWKNQAWLQRRAMGLFYCAGHFNSSPAHGTYHVPDALWLLLQPTMTNELALVRFLYLQCQNVSISHSSLANIFPFVFTTCLTYSLSIILLRSLEQSWGFLSPSLVLWVSCCPSLTGGKWETADEGKHEADCVRWKGMPSYKSPASMHSAVSF